MRALLKSYLIVNLKQHSSQYHQMVAEETGLPPIKRGQNQIQVIRFLQAKGNP